jgi:predicted membrane channel-forming protein YqfA (hemolysin III family)
MIAGFILAVISILIYMQTRYQGNAVPQIAFGCTIVGFVIYIIGRLFMANKKYRTKKSRLSDSATKDDL